MPIVNYDRILTHAANPMCAQDQDVCAQALPQLPPAITIPNGMRIYVRALGHPATACNHVYIYLWQTLIAFVTCLGAE
jgi:hypothetical protein